MMRRMDIEAGSVFNKSLEQYESGFGILYDSFWMGLETIHRITNAYDVVISFDTIDQEYTVASRKHEAFVVKDKSSGHSINITSYPTDGKTYLYQNI